MPTTRGAGLDGSGDRRISRSTVSPLTGMNSRHDSRAPASPPSAMPMLVCARARRLDRRTLVPARAGTGSVKTCPGQRRQRKRRTWTRHSTALSCQGRSAILRQRRSCTHAVTSPQAGHAAPVAVGVAVISNRTPSNTTLPTCKPAGTSGKDGFWSDMVNGPAGHSAINVSPGPEAYGSTSGPVCLCGSQLRRTRAET